MFSYSSPLSFLLSASNQRPSAVPPKKPTQLFNFPLKNPGHSLYIYICPQLLQPSTRLLSSTTPALWVALMIFPQIAHHHQRHLRKIVSVACNKRIPQTAPPRSTPPTSQLSPPTAPQLWKSHNLLPKKPTSTPQPQTPLSLISVHQCSSAVSQILSFALLPFRHSKFRFVSDFAFRISYLPPRQRFPKSSHLRQFRNGPKLRMILVHQIPASEVGAVVGGVGVGPGCQADPLLLR